ncbi:alphaK I11 [Puccinia sorghi]|uniref:AlphaK I11 n=1 Tax=Puccinia sorghi TaxID=27349 RepID=A0A0L6UHA1_9BASI|nr:alphaK I11 [Puccinia sorghi]
MGGWCVPFLEELITQWLNQLSFPSKKAPSSVPKYGTISTKKTKTSKNPTFLHSSNDSLINCWFLFSISKNLQNKTGSLNIKDKIDLTNPDIFEYLMSQLWDVFAEEMENPLSLVNHEIDVYMYQASTLLLNKSKNIIAESQLVLKHSVVSIDTEILKHYLLKAPLEGTNLKSSRYIDFKFSKNQPGNDWCIC